MPDYWNNLMSIYPNLHQDLVSSELLFESGGRIVQGTFGLKGSEFVFMDKNGYEYDDVTRWKYVPKQEVMAG